MVRRRPGCAGRLRGRGTAVRTRIAIPVALYTVRYETRRGRPYSGFERLVLDAVADGAGDIGELEELFGVHRRIVVECVVTLVQAGWVAVAADGALVATAAGREAAHIGGIPRTTEVNAIHAEIVLLDQHRGGLALRSDATYTNRGRAEKYADVMLARKIHRRSLEPLEVQHLLRTRHGEWISWIDPIIQLSTNNLHYVVGELDSANGTIVNVPAAFLDALPEDLVEDVAEATSAVSVEGDDDSYHSRSRWITAVDPSDVVVGTAEHSELLEGVLKEGARSRVLIASAFLSAERLTHLGPSLHAALLRGVDIDLLWGYDTPDAAERVAQLDQVVQTAEMLKAPGRLTYNRSAAQSHIKVLAFDSQPGTWSVVVGSHNWLSARPGGDLVDISIGLQHPGIAAEIGTLVSEAMRTDTGADGRSCAFWRNLGSSIVNDPGEPDAGKPVNVVSGRSHEIVLRNALRRSRSRLTISSHQFGSVARRRLAARSAPVDFSGRVCVADFHDDLAQADADRLAASAGLALETHPTLHAKVIVSDDEVTIGSYNYLSTDTAGAATRHRELSVTVSDGALAEYIDSILRAPN